MLRAAGYPVYPRTLLNQLSWLTILVMLFLWPLYLPATDSPVALNLMGAAYFHKGEYKTAESVYKTALGIQPDFLPAHLNLAQLYIVSGDMKSGQQRYRKVLTYDKDNEKALLALVAIAESEGNQQQAEQLLVQVHSAHPEVDPMLPLLLLSLMGLMRRRSAAVANM